MILVGDSAGGNLILGLLSHLLHPHPSLEPLVLPKPLLGAAVISPWGDFNTSAPSYTSNQYKDSVNAAVLQKWSDYFMGSAKADEYNQPFRAASSWWENLSGKVQNMLITAGSDEVLVDDIMAFAEKIKVGSSAIIRFVVSRLLNMGSDDSSQYGHCVGNGGGP